MLRIAKRAECSLKYKIAVRLFAIIAAIIFSGLLFLISDFNPIDVFSSMLKGAIGNRISLIATIRKAIPLIICALGISVAFRMKFWNIGAEGQVIVGAIFATFIVREMPAGTTAWIVLPAMAISAIIGGGLWAAIPGVFRAQFGTNETIFTLMMNYIALQWVIWLQYVRWIS
ncbi:MAG: ABC transporter permease, partial [Lentisphaeria bacterium]